MQVPATVNPYADGVDVRGFELDELWPQVDPEFKPFGAKVLVQLRRVIDRTKSGIILTDDTMATEAWNTQVGKVIALGDLAYKSRKDGQHWPEGPWVQLGDFVRFTRYAGDRLTIKMEDGGKPVTILIMNDHDLLGQYTGDPRLVRTFIE